MGRFFGPTPNIISAEGFFRGSAGTTTRTWSQVTTGFESTGEFFFCSFANGLYLITYQSGTVSSVITSSDLVTFTKHNIAAAANYTPRSVAFGASTYFTVLDNNPTAFGIHGYTSPDLVTWTLRATGFPATAANQRVFLPVFGNGVFLLVSQESAAYATSPNGVTWTQRSTYVPNNWGQPIFDGSKFVAAVMGSANTPKIATSTDGVTWTESTATLGAAFTAGPVPFFVGNDGTGQYIAGESHDDSGDSLNGALTTVTAFSFSDSGNATGSSPVWSGGSWARSNANNADLVSSTNGLTWHQDTVPATAHFWNNIAFGSKFIVVGGDNSGHNMLASRSA